MAILGFELDEIARLIALVETHGLQALVIEEEGKTLRIHGPRSEPSVKREVVPLAPESSPLAWGGEAVVPPLSRPTLPKPPPTKPPSDPKALPPDQLALVSPMVGVFYRSDKPGSSAFVHEGDTVAVGQTIGLIEAMKIFSEIPAEHGGTVVAVVAKDGQLVQAGTPLMILKRG